MKQFLCTFAALLVALVAPSITVQAGGYFNSKTGNYEMPPPKITMEKTIPTEFFGEWCYVGDNGANEGINYRLPSWSDPGMCDNKTKLLSISEQNISAENIDCALTSKVKVIIECAPSGCGTRAKFMASCSSGSSPHAQVEVYRYKGNLDLKSKASDR